MLVFDLDNTLYPYQSGLYAHINQRMNQFISEKLHLSFSVVDEIRTRYIDQFGTTQQGLYYDYGIMAEEFLSFAHDIDIEKFLQPSPELRDYLHEVPYPKFLFTNSPYASAKKELSYLQIEPLFQQLITIETLNYIGKPNRSAFEKLIQCLPPAPDQVILVDDDPKNIEMGRQFGFTSILVDGKQIPVKKYYNQFLIPLLKGNL